MYLGIFHGSTKQRIRPIALVKKVDEVPGIHRFELLFVRGTPDNDVVSNIQRTLQQLYITIHSPIVVSKRCISWRNVSCLTIPMATCARKPRNVLPPILDVSFDQG